MAERVAAAAPGVRILYMSGYLDEDIAARGFETGPLLQKPFTAGTLLDAVRTALGGAPADARLDIRCLMREMLSR